MLIILGVYRYNFQPPVQDLLKTTEAAASPASLDATAMVACRRHLRSAAVHQLFVLYHVIVAACLALVPSLLSVQQSGIRCLSIYVTQLLGTIS